MLIFQSLFYGEAGNSTAFEKNTFCGFSWVETSTGPGGFMICLFYYMTGTPEGSTESGFMEKPGIEPATPNVQMLTKV